uniref:Caspase-14 isoform X3 n=1 Tax=Geotrypetes seraphini TaxID=260995 RepID=A0A6P8RFD8_GEOSA|nr:caspase-14 isoform X3 [Geotrypetes seraphini]
MGGSEEMGAAQLCSSHGLPLKYFCKTDQLGVCAECIAGGLHREHPYLNMEEASKQCKAISDPAVKPTAAGVLSSAPLEVTLLNVWGVLHRMEGTVLKTAQETSELVRKMDSLSKTIENVKADNEAKFQLVHEDIKTLKTAVDSLIKDKLVVHRKIEHLENFNRKLNLRFLNFPKTLEISAVELFRKYLIQNLNFSPEAILPLNKIYYLPMKKNPGTEVEIENQIQQVPPTMDLDNLSAILETTTTIEERATLLVSYFSTKFEFSIETLFSETSNSLYGSTYMGFS